MLVLSARTITKVAHLGLEISTQETTDVTIVHLRGRATIGGGESELLSNYLKKLLASGARKLLLNLRGLTQIDSSGVGIIVGTYVSVRRQGGDLKLLCPSDRVRKVLTVFHLLDIIESFEDEAQAVASFRPSDYPAIS